MKLHTQPSTTVEWRIQRLGLVQIKNYFHYTMMKLVSVDENRIEPMLEDNAVLRCKFDMRFSSRWWMQINIVFN